MDSALEDQFLQKVEEFVYDEDKIVTFKWFSETVNISISDSKKVLEKYAEDHQKRSNLGIFYWISGKLNDDSVNILLVKKDELDAKVSTFKEVLCKFVYSVYKDKDIDIKAQTLVSQFDFTNKGNGFITNKCCVKRTLKAKAPLPELKKVDMCKQKSLFANVPPKKIKTEKEDTPADKLTSTNSSNNSSTLSNKKTNGTSGGIANFFSKMPSKTEIKSTKSKTEGIKQEPKSDSEEKEDKVNENFLKEKTRGKLSNIIDSDESEDEDLINTQVSNHSEKETKKKTNPKRKRGSSKSKAQAQKRRKRIVEQNDSDSDDIFGNDENDVPNERMEESEEEILFKPKPEPVPKNKKRKLVTQTYTDEEGYILTRKEWVSDSGSEEETKNQKEEKKEDINESKPVQNNSAKEEKKEILHESKPESNSVKNKKLKGDADQKVESVKSKGGKGKKPASNQSTLMNFFKKA